MSPILETLRPASDVMSQVLVITGMHRSGTSLVSNLLQSAGVHVGDNLIAANVANPRGYFEDVGFYEFHEHLLHERGQSYLYAAFDGAFEAVPEETARARQLIAERSTQRLWGWKDPRTSLFLDFWHELLPQARFLFVYRHPIDVLLSLLRRGEFDEHPNLSAGLEAWQTYNAKIAEFYDEHAEDCLLVHIDGVVGHIDRFAHLLQDKLQLDFQLEPEAFDQIFHANELRKTPVPSEAQQILKTLQPGLLELYHRLNACADLPEVKDQTSGEKGVARPHLEILTQVAKKLLEPIGISAKQSLLQMLVAMLAPERADEMLSRFNRNAKGLQQKVDTMWLYAQQLERTNRTHEDSIQSQQSILALQQAQLAAQFSQILDQDRTLSDLAVRTGSLSAELGSIREMWTWKVGRSLGRLKERVWKKKIMATQVHQAALPSPVKGTMAQRIAQVRAMQTELRTRPVTGSMGRLKKMVFQIVRSTFSRQFTLNSVTIDLIESLYRDLERHKPILSALSDQPQDQANRVTAIAPPIDQQFSSDVALASCGQTQDQARLNNIRRLNGFEFVYASPAEMRMPERVALYSLVFGLQPRNCLEIGSFRCGSSAIIFGALEDTGCGQLACVEPDPQVDPQLWSRIRTRCRLFEGHSPDILPEVVRQTGDKFDFALIDGDHHYESVCRDVEGLLPFLADEAYLLFHDAHSDWVKRALGEIVAANANLTDCGMLSVEPTVLQENGQSETWAGLRLLRFQRKN